MGRMPAPEKPLMSDDPPRFMIIGAGSRGNTYARFIGEASNGICHGVVEPIASKRLKLGRRYIWGDTTPDKGQEFADWKDFVAWELNRRHKEKAGEKVPPGVDGVFICVQDGLHKEVILGLAPLDLHIMCEKPLATNLEDVVAIYKTLLSNCSGKPTRIFSIGHVLRYSPHNMLLRKLLLEDKVIGDILSINHTEPVGWWHFAHSYVRYVALPFQLPVPNPIRNPPSTNANEPNNVQRQLAPRAHLRPLPAHQILPRHRPPPLAPLLTTAFFSYHRYPTATPPPRHNHRLRRSAILPQRTQTPRRRHRHKLPLLPPRVRMQVLSEEDLSRSPGDRVQEWEHEVAG